MKCLKSGVVVAGDVRIDTMLWSTSALSKKDHNRGDRFLMHKVSRAGGALLLAEMVSMSVGEDVHSAAVPSSDVEDCVHLPRLVFEIKPFPRFSSDSLAGETYRVDRFMGFSDAEKPSILHVCNDIPGAGLVILDDQDNGFNSDEAYWPAAIKDPAQKPIIIYKMDNPTEGSALWDHLVRNHSSRTIVVIDADSLRSKGVNISKGLSWEKTALDFIWQIANNSNLSFLMAREHLVILFGLEGVIHYRGGVDSEADLYFLPHEFEGDALGSDRGEMYGLSSAFIAGFSSACSDGEKLSILLPIGIRLGMTAARRYFCYGFGENPDICSFPDSRIFSTQSETTSIDCIRDARIPSESGKLRSDWRILQGEGSASIAQISFDLVKEGEESALTHMPVARFGRMKTADRAEIESYRTMYKLITEYVFSEKPVRPLSIAVFGAPGSGKSYGITELATSAFPDEIRCVGYNLSQFSSPAELHIAFREMSDFNLEGKLPLVVFDEFDARLQNHLGWLRYFLSPMQDGVYRDGEALHPIGRAIFVFVGGTSGSFSDFCGEGIEDEDEKKAFMAEFSRCKGPDFVSRLRGYVNILGPNQKDADDRFFMIRRAMLLRSLIEHKFPRLIDGKKKMRIDDGVLRAMLKIPSYKHGLRSMEAIMDMSMLAHADKWDQSSLPPAEQLRLHLDDGLFIGYMMHDAIFSEKVEAIAKILRDKLNNLGSPVFDGDDASMPWMDLEEKQRLQYMNHVRSIPEALLRIRYDLLYIDRQADEIAFSKEEVDELARFETMHGDTDIYRPVDPSHIAKNEIRFRLMISFWASVLAEANFKLEKLDSEF